MAITTIHLSDELQNRIAIAARRRGKSPDSLILEAIAEKLAFEENNSAFYAEADRRYAAVQASGGTISWTRMRERLEARITHDASQPPKISKNG